MFGTSPALRDRPSSRFETLAEPGLGLKVDDTQHIEQHVSAGDAVRDVVIGLLEGS